MCGEHPQGLLEPARSHGAGGLRSSARGPGEQAVASKRRTGPPVQWELLGSAAWADSNLVFSVVVTDLASQGVGGWGRRLDCSESQLWHRGYSCVALWPGVLEDSVPAAQLGLASGDTGEWPRDPRSYPRWVGGSQDSQASRGLPCHRPHSLACVPENTAFSQACRRRTGELPGPGRKRERVCGGRGAAEPGPRAPR